MSHPTTVPGPVKKPRPLLRRTRKGRKLRWIVELQVDESWVADGFCLTDTDAQEMLAKRLQWAFSHELQATVLASPSAYAVAKAQGYKTVEQFLTDSSYVVDANGVIRDA